MLIILLTNTKNFFDLLITITSLFNRNKAGFLKVVFSWGLCQFDTLFIFQEEELIYYQYNTTQLLINLLGVAIQSKYTEIIYYMLTSLFLFEE